MAKLSKPMQARLKKHSAHHTPKHMAAMRSRIKNGMSFKKAHSIAQKKVGN
jgi:hypothetical protein|tara:strand:+ start:366 stop:518 length:153 start_codon:yes stop_codon:yes gene_type:complete